MLDKEILKDVNLKCAIQGKVKYKLKDILKSYDKYRLTDIYYSITKKEINEGKNKIIDKVYEELTDENVINKLLNNLAKKEYDALLRIINSGANLQDDYIFHKDFQYLISSGIVYTFNCNNKLYTIIPNDIMEVLNNMNIDAYHKKSIENTKIIDLAISMLNLYGVVPMDLFIDSCIKYYKYKKPYDINLDCIFLPERTISVKIIETESNMYFINGEYADEPDIFLMYKIIGLYEDNLFKFDFKSITLNELLKYNDMFYFEECDGINELKKYLRKYINYEEIDSLLSVTIQTFRKDYNEGILFINEIFEDSDIEITEKNIDKILEYVNKIVENIPLWGNKGWTNKEIILRKNYEEN